MSLSGSFLRFYVRRWISLSQKCSNDDGELNHTLLNKTKNLIWYFWKITKISLSLSLLSLLFSSLSTHYVFKNLKNLTETQNRNVQKLRREWERERVESLENYGTDKNWCCKTSVRWWRCGYGGTSLSLSLTQIFKNFRNRRRKREINDDDHRRLRNRFTRNVRYGHC